MECPLKYAGNNELELMSMVEFMRKGNLPKDGGVFNQPWRLMEFIQYTHLQMRNEDRRLLGRMAGLIELVG